MLTENEIARNWRTLFHEENVNEETFARAETLLEELRAESPLRHRLECELNELRRLRSKKAPAPKRAARRAKTVT